MGLPGVADAYHAVVAANHECLALCSPGSQEPTLKATRAALERAGQGWLDCTRRPLAIGVPAGDGHRLVGTVNLTIDASPAVPRWVLDRCRPRAGVTSLGR